VIDKALPVNISLRYKQKKNIPSIKVLINILILEGEKIIYLKKMKKQRATLTFFGVIYIIEA